VSAAPKPDERDVALLEAQRALTDVRETIAVLSKRMVSLAHVAGENPDADLAREICSAIASVHDAELGLDSVQAALSGEKSEAARG